MTRFLLVLCLCLLTEATTAATTSPATSQASSSADLKDRWVGLVANKGLPAEGLEEIMPNAMLPVDWQDLEPEEGKYDFTKIDEFLKQAKARNINVGIRLFCGQTSPDWLKKKTGTVEVFNRASQIRREIPLFWLPEYGEAYEKLQKALAEKYDNDPRVLVATMSRCMTTYAEPFQRQVADKETVQRLIAAGFTPEIDYAAQIETVKAHERAWKRTRSSFAINPYHAIRETSRKYDAEFTGRFMKEAAAILGNRFLLQNNSLRDNPKMMREGEYGDMFKMMTALHEEKGLPIGFQCAAPSRVGDLKKAIEEGIRLGGCYAEVRQDFRKEMSEEDARELQKELAKNWRP